MITSTQKIYWTDFSRGFHGGRFESAPEIVYQEDDDKCSLQFSVEEFTSDTEDFFGVACPMWRLSVEIIRIANNYTDKVTWGIGDEFAQSEFAKEFAEYVLESYKKHESLACLPVAVLDGYK
jgi:hypothetical protein